jgi:protein-S-isoprenylcysteine O-methyltransferase Ste14
MDIGFAGVFRSSVAVALLPIVFWMFKRRMDVEEQLLVEEFGETYRGYMGRTARLLPGVY